MTENEISYKVRGAIFKVFKVLGPGLLESVYERVLIYELQKQGLEVKSQVAIPVHYDGLDFGADLRVDLIIENKVIVELKSVEDVREVYFKQLLTYLRLKKMKLGLLVNFNEVDVADGIHRVINGHL